MPTPLLRKCLIWHNDQLHNHLWHCVKTLYNKQQTHQLMKLNGPDGTQYVEHQHICCCIHGSVQSKCGCISYVCVPCNNEQHWSAESLAHARCVRFCSCLRKVWSRVSEAVLLVLQTLSLSFITITLPQTAFLRFIAFSMECHMSKYQENNDVYKYHIV